jgi:hypothetical protein
MARLRKSRLFPVALSIDGAHIALNISRRAIVAAIYQTAELPAHVGPNGRVRITVTDLTDWVKSWPRATLARTTRRKDITP